MKLEKIRRNLGKTLRKRREELNLTQETVVENAEISQSYLSQLENGFRSPSFSLLCDFANYYQLSLAELFKRAEV